MNQAIFDAVQKAVDGYYKNLSMEYETLPTELHDPVKPVGLKFDNEKPRIDLVDPWAIEGLAKVLTFGAQKYAAHNWRNGIVYSRLISALERHLLAIKKGEDIDPESGLPHIDHLGCCWMFLSHFMKTESKELDDRWISGKTHDSVR